MRIEKKIKKEWFDMIESGKKKYEIRMADFDIGEGDELALREWDPEKKEYTGREIVKKAIYVRKFKNKEELMAANDPAEVDKYGFYIIQLE